MCPTCGGASVETTPGPSTLVAVEPWVDADGRTHVHDPNTHSAHHRCAAGHAWVTTSTHSCWCGWPAQAGDGRAPVCGRASCQRLAAGGALTEDIGRCALCGAETSSGSIRACGACARRGHCEFCAAALEGGPASGPVAEPRLKEELCPEGGAHVGLPALRGPCACGGEITDQLMTMCSACAQAKGVCAYCGKRVPK